MQDVIEIFFSTIRRKFGNNNNPNAFQLKAAVRGVVCMKIANRIVGNCVPQLHSSFNVSPLGNVKSVRTEIIDSSTLEELEMEELVDTLAGTDVFLSVFSSNIVVYISGFVARRIYRKLNCITCIGSLCATEEEKETFNQDRILIHLRDNGGLIHPSRELIKMCKVVELEIRKRQNTITSLNKIEIRKASIRVALDELIFDDLRGRITDEHDTFSDHPYQLLKMVTDIYFKVRIHYIGKKKTLDLKPINNRNRNTNNTKFAGN